MDLSINVCMVKGDDLTLPEFRLRHILSRNVMDHSTDREATQFANVMIIDVGIFYLISYVS